MSTQTPKSVENFDIIDGQVNVELADLSHPTYDNSCQKQVNFSTNFGTTNSNEPQTEFLIDLRTFTETEILSNERQQEERDGTVLEPLNEEDQESLDQQFNGTLEQITLTDHRIIEENSTISYPSSNTIQTKITIISRDEGTERNDSKNVPKGMMKALGHMILDKDQNTVRILKGYFERSGESYEEFKELMRSIRKSSKISISEIRSLLMEGEFAGTMRRLGCYFLRKRFLNHIFNSKMEKRHIHMKYIPKWIQIFKNPSEFTSLK